MGNFGFDILQALVNDIAPAAKVMHARVAQRCSAGSPQLSWSAAAAAVEPLRQHRHWQHPASHHHLQGALLLAMAEVPDIAKADRDYPANVLRLHCVTMQTLPLLAM